MLKHILFFLCLTMVNPLFSSDMISSKSSSYIEKQGSQVILHLKGSPYEMGYQHGKLLKDSIAANVKQFVDGAILSNQSHPQVQMFLANLPKAVTFIPDDYKQELKGLAEGSEISYDKILLLNLLPEMFHCTGLTVSGQATEGGKLYHVRVLDYAVGKNLQNTAVLMVVEPEGKIPFLNVSYAGFIGSVTGMNVEKIALGEIGGRGYGHWEGMPMSFLLRHILEQASSLDGVRSILTTIPRTCEYYYVFSDGKDGHSVGVYATSRQIQFINPGTAYALFDQSDSKPSEDKLFLTQAQINASPYQVVLYKDAERKQQLGLIHYQPVDCLALTGCSYPERYLSLMQRINQSYGHIGVEDLINIIKSPVSRKDNLHNAIFAPASLDVWISHAGPNGECACDQPYQHYNLLNLIK